MPVYFVTVYQDGFVEVVFVRSWEEHLVRCLYFVAVWVRVGIGGVFCWADSRRLVVMVVQFGRVGVFWLAA
jgi:hypothetical protein